MNNMFSRFVQFLRGLIAALFGQKSSDFNSDTNPNPENHPESHPFGKIPDPEVKVVIRRRKPLAIMMDTIALPEVHADIIGKHHVICRESAIYGHFKVLGQISSNGFARIRRFGGGENQHMVRLLAG